MAAISNSSPLILYARIGQLDLLYQVFTGLLVPPAVHTEVILAGAARLDAAVVAAAAWIQVRSLARSTASQALLRGLDRGEAEAIALALEMGKQVAVLLDDRKARRMARQLGLRVHGSAGVLVLAKELGIVSSIRLSLDELRSAGLYLDDATYHRVLLLAGEMAQ